MAIIDPRFINLKKPYQKVEKLSIYVGIKSQVLQKIENITPIPLFYD